MSPERLSRRRFLGGLAAGSGLLLAVPLLNACGGGATAPTAAPTASGQAAAPTAAPTGTAGGSPTAAPTATAATVTPVATGRPTGQTVKLTNVENDSRPLDNKAYENVYKAFREKHPNIEIEFQILPWEQAEAKERTMAEAGTLPDMGRANFAASLVKLDAMVPLDDLATSDYLARYPKSWIDDLYFEGPDKQRHLYAVAWFAGDKAILINKTFFDEAGLTRPASWTTDEFVEAAKKLTIPNKRWGVTIDAAGIGDPWQNFWLCVRAFGGGFVKGRASDSKSPEPVTINSPEFIKGATWWRDLYKNGYAVPSAPTDTYKERDANFMSGKAAMMWQGPWSLIDQRETLKKQGWELAALPLPKGPAGNPQSSGLAGLAGIFSTARKRGVVQEAWQWVSFLCSDEGQKIYSGTNGMLPASQALWKDPQFANDPIYSGYLEGFQNGDRDYPIWAVGVQSVFDQKGVPMMQGLLLNQLTPEQMAQQLQDEVIRFLENNGIKVPRG
ncbi:MAG TPA: sugar ABC transporter substrate-binding protein [Chloroflexota bacterium]|nr:sugar ABC transporter substrate-binding protein [Chloroflexota bacterium]